MRDQNQTLILDRGKYTACSINLHGATITSWRVLNKEQLYVNKRSYYDKKTPIRGGISVAFPHFGNCPFGPNFGFASIHSWSVDESPRVLANGDVLARLSCKDDNWTRSMWDYPFCLSLTLILREVELELNYEVVNKSETERMDCHLCVFTSLRVNSVRQTHLLGLGGCIFNDRTLDLPDYLRTFTKDTNITLTVTEKTDRLYCNTPRSLFLVEPIEKRIIRLTKTNMSCSTVWNPWDKTNKKPEVLQDYEKYLTVGAGECLQKKILEPGGEFKTTFKVQLDPFTNKYGDLLELEMKGVTFWTFPTCSSEKCDCSCYCQDEACYCACYCEKN